MSLKLSYVSELIIKTIKILAHKHNKHIDVKKLVKMSWNKLFPTIAFLSVFSGHTYTSYIGLIFFMLWFFLDIEES